MIQVLNQSLATTLTFHLLLSPRHSQASRQDGADRGERKRGRESEKMHDEELGNRGEEWEGKEERKKERNKENRAQREGLMDGYGAWCWERLIRSDGRV